MCAGSGLGAPRFQSLGSPYAGWGEGWLRFHLSLGTLRRQEGVHRRVVGEGCRLLPPAGQGGCVGRSKACLSFPSPNPESGSAGASLGDPTCQAPSHRAGCSLPRKHSRIPGLAWPARCHLTSLSSSHLPAPGQVTPGLDSAGAPGFLPGVRGHQGGTSVGRPPSPQAPRGLPNPRCLPSASWLPGTGIMTFLEGAHLPLGCNAMIAPNGVSNHGHCQSGNSSVHPQTAVSRSCGLLQCHPHPPTY